MADNFDKSLGSISVSISKGSVYESGGLSMFDAALEDALRREEKSISNESIQKGDTLLETYTVEANAISGGMGSVWRVHHQSWNTDLAMKRPQPRFFAEGSKKRKENFIKECEAWINLGLHPNIVSCYYVREIGGVPTIFSEWMNNGSLKDRIRDGSLYIGTEVEQEERLLDLAIQFARGLRYSHENGLIHRDVKPDNLLLTKDWDAKVADFGLAKARDEAISEDGTAHKGGYTPEYCSGEQAAELYTDARTDVYSWALTVLEMYTKGRVWESGPTVSKNREQFINAVKLPLPEGLRGLLYRCFEADADKRPGDLAEIEATLREIYKSKTDGEYPRPEPKAAADTADSLNNRALSFLDLGKPEQAQRLWDKALRMETNQIACTCNQQLWLWRNAKITDAAAAQTLRAQYDKSGAPEVAKALLSLYMEAGQYEEAKEFSKIPAVQPLITADRNWQDELLKTSRFTLNFSDTLKHEVTSAAWLSDNTLLVADGSNYLRRFHPESGSFIESIDTKSILGIDADRLMADPVRGGCYVFASNSDCANGAKPMFLSRMIGDTIAARFSVPKRPVSYQVSAGNPRSVDMPFYRLAEVWLSEDGTTLFALADHQYNCTYDDTNWNDWYTHAWNADTGEYKGSEHYDDFYDAWAPYDTLSVSGKYKMRCERSTYLLFEQESGRCLRTLNVYTGAGSSRGFSQGKCSFSADERFWVVPQAEGPLDVGLYSLSVSGAASQLFLSKITSTAEAARLKKEKIALKSAFESAVEKQDMERAIEIFSRFRDQPGNGNAEETVAMERRLSKFCIRAGVHHATRESAGDVALAGKPYRRLDTKSALYRKAEKYFSKDSVARIRTEYDTWLQKQKYDAYLSRDDGRFVIAHYGAATARSTDVNFALVRFDTKNMTHETLGWGCALTPDGRIVVGLIDHSITFQSAGQAAKTKIPTGIEVFPKEITFSPDSRFACCKGSLGNVKMICLVSVPPESSVFRIPVESYIRSPLSFSEDGFCLLDENREVSYRLSYTYSFPGWADWDDGAAPYLDSFVFFHPNESPSDVQDLTRELQSRGFGWLRPDAVNERLRLARREMSKTLFGLSFKK